MRKRISLDDSDVHRGDPAQLVIGRVEQSARRHAPLPSKPKTVNAHTIRFDITKRLDRLRPLVAEYKRLDRAHKLLKEIDAQSRIH